MSVPAGFFLNIFKPCGMTSHHVVAKLRRLLPRKTKVGHLGTLDPDASGVLPVAIGRATKLIPYVQADRKGYRALIQFGVQTDTDDWTGTVLKRTDPPKNLTLEVVQGQAEDFLGIYRQVPPRYSALKVEGKRSYALARQGKDVPLEARPVRFEQISCFAYEPKTGCCSVDILCGTGTYVRSFARDLAQALGTVGSLRGLLRWNSNDFLLLDSLLLQDFSEKNIQEHGVAPSRLLKVDAEVPLACEPEEAIFAFRELDIPVGRYLLKGTDWKALALSPTGGERCIITRWSECCDQPS